MKIFLIFSMSLLRKVSYRKPMQPMHYLINENFDTFLKDHPTILIISSSAMCPTCDETKSFVQKVADEIPYRNVAVGELDITGENALSVRLELTEYPQISLFHKGKAIVYKGEFIVSYVLAWIDQIISGASMHIISAEQLTDFRNKNPSLLYFLPEKNNQELQIFNILVKENPNVYWGHVTTATLKAAEQITSPFALVFASLKFTGRRILLGSKAFTAAEIKEFCNTASAPDVTALDSETSSLILSGTKSAAVLLSHVEDTKLVDAFEQMAKEFKQRLLFASGAGDAVRLGDFRAQLDVTWNQNVVALFRRGTKGLESFLCTDVSLSALRTCFNAFLNGELKPYQRKNDASMRLLFTPRTIKIHG